MGEGFKVDGRSYWNHKLHVAPFSLDLPSNDGKVPRRLLKKAVQQGRSR
jgi:hypothetical protein